MRKILFTNWKTRKRQTRSKSDEKEIRRISKEKLERKMEYTYVNDEKDGRMRGRNSNARGREVGWKYSRRRRGRP